MGDLIVSLVPLAIGIVMSPLAIMALVAVLVSRRARPNGIAFFLGWALAVAVGLTVSFLIFGAFTVHERGIPPLWVPIVRLLIGLLLLAGAVWIYRRGRAHAAAMVAAQSPTQVVAAAPQLPGWLQKVSTFTPLRSFALGVGIFILNPVDASCAVLAGLEVRLADVEAATEIVTLVVFGMVAVLPIGVPVLLVLIRGEKAAPALETIRIWIGSHTNVLNAALVLVIAVLQLQKALSALIAY